MKMQSCHFSMWTFLSICIHSAVSFTSLCILVFPWRSLAAWRYTTVSQCQSMSLSISPLRLSLFRTYPSPSHSHLSCLNLAFKHRAPSVTSGSCYLADWRAGVHLTWLDPGHCHLCEARFLSSSPGSKMKAQTKLRSLRFSNCIGLFVYMKSIWVRKACGAWGRREDSC